MWLVYGNIHKSVSAFVCLFVCLFVANWAAGVHPHVAYHNWYPVDDPPQLVYLTTRVCIASGVTLSTRTLQVRLLHTTERSDGDISLLSPMLKAHKVIHSLSHERGWFHALILAVPLQCLYLTQSCYMPTCRPPYNLTTHFHTVLTLSCIDFMDDIMGDTVLSAPRPAPPPPTHRRPSHGGGGGGKGAAAPRIKRWGESIVSLP